MSELRKDPVADRWVIYSSGKTSKPSDYPTTRAADVRRRDPDCPFCEGNETFAGPEIYSRRHDSSTWSLRCIPNQRPALKVEGELNRDADGIYDCMNGIGAHEIIIETPRHDQNLADLDVVRFSDALLAFKARILDLSRDIRFRYIMCFKNHGKAAGQVINHSHSQLIALPFVPLRVGQEIERCARYYESKDRYLFTDIVKQELKDQRRIVCENERFIAVCPYAARFPFETWIIPKTHNPSYEKESDENIHQLASLFRNALYRINKALDYPAYNFLLHSAPVNLPSTAADKASAYTWHFELIPKLSRIAGFEWGSGCYINDALPEESAAFLRDVVSEE